MTVHSKLAGAGLTDDLEGGSAGAPTAPPGCNDCLTLSSHRVRFTHSLQPTFHLRAVNDPPWIVVCTPRSTTGT